MSESTPDLDELLDGALDDFRDVPPGSGASASQKAKDPPAGASAASASSLAPGSRSKPPLPNAGLGDANGSQGKGPSLPPRPKPKKSGQPKMQSVDASEQHQHRRQPPPDADAVPSQMPDLAATLQALAQSGGAVSPSSSRGDAAPAGMPDLGETLRAAAAATAASRPDGALPQGDSDALLAELTEQLRAMGHPGEDPEQMNSFVSGIMRQLLSKDVLHQSMKDIGARYPQWLDANAPQLSQEDLARYSQQYRHIVDICTLYDTDPDNFSALYDKLQQMQSCGTPPEDIVQELSPGLQFDGEGLPKMPDGVPGCCVQ